MYKSTFISPHKRTRKNCVSLLSTLFLFICFLLSPSVFAQKLTDQQAQVSGYIGINQDRLSSTATEIVSADCDLVISTDDISACEVESSGVASVDLATRVTSPTGCVLSFYLNEADAGAGTNALTSSIVNAPAGKTTRYWVRAQSGDCNRVDYIDVTVGDKPDISIGNINLCETGNSGYTTVNLLSRISNPDNAVLSFYLTEADANAGVNALSSSTINAPAGRTTRYWVRADLGDCICVDYINVTIIDNPDVTTTSTTICEGETVDLNALVTHKDGGVITFHLTQEDASSGINALTNTTVSPAKGQHTYFVRSSITVNKVTCYGIATILVTVKSCSSIKLEKTTGGVVDPSKTWSFTLSGGGLNITQTVANDNDGILFDNIAPLSVSQKYTICETNVPTGYSVNLQYLDASGNWQNIPWYDPNVINGGGDFNQGEAVGNYCFEFGAGTAIPLPTNTYGGGDPVCLRFKINNIPPPGGTARTPGYWKNWNTCTKGNQVQTAIKNGGTAAGVYLLDDHLPHTLWSVANQSVSCTKTKFTITSCNQGVNILDERQNGTNTKMSSDAAYKLAKHLMAYQLNIKSGSQACASAAAAATQAEALLAKYCFDGTGSSYLSSKVKTADYNTALQLAKVLDAYNNNLPCVNSTLTSAKTVQQKAVEAKTDDVTVSKISVNAVPNPYTDKIRFSLQSPVSGQGSLEVFNMLGQKVKTVFQGYVEANQSKTVEFAVPAAQRTNLIYMFKVGDHRTIGKLIH